MLKQRFIVGLAVLMALVLGVQANSFAFGKKDKKEVKFKVRIENVSNSEGLLTTEGSKYPFALSPGLFTITKIKTNFFKVGKMAKNGLEEQAEDGNPTVLTKNLATKIGSINLGIFNIPLGTDKPAPILPGGAFEFTFTATEGMKLNLIAMYGQSKLLQIRFAYKLPPDSVVLPFQFL
ncbi:hypothetical protein BH10ACI1_BH10ACI1_28560 [soil metagenome]